MAIDGFSVNGTALVYVGTGSANALEVLGITEQGVDMDITEFKEGIQTDLFGPDVPQDFQYMGMMGRLVCPFIDYDRAVMNKIINRADQTGGTVGNLGTPGLPLGSNGYAFPIYIAAPLDVPWYFYYALTQTEGMRLATKANPFRVTFLTWPFQSYTSTNGKDAPFFRRSMS